MIGFEVGFDLLVSRIQMYGKVGPDWRTVNRTVRRIFVKIDQMNSVFEKQGESDQCVRSVFITGNLIRDIQDQVYQTNIEFSSKIV